MNKKLRIVLMVVITAALVLAIAIPALASPPTGAECKVWWRYWTPDGQEAPIVWIEGRQGFSWEGSTLTVTCEGYIRLGEDWGHVTYFTLAEAKERICEELDVCLGEEDPLFFDINDNPTRDDPIYYQGDYYTLIPDGYWSYLVEYDGHFLYTRVAEIE